MSKKVSPRGPVVVNERYTYVAGDALRTLGGLGAIWSHHVHGGDINDKTLNTVAEALRSDITHHLHIACDNMDPQECFNTLAEHCVKNFYSLSDQQISNCIASIWSELPRLRTAARTAKGSVSSLQVSRGGVPKKAIEAAEIDLSGLVGDKQSNRTHHGRPWQAVCLWSREVLDAFIAAGHPIEAGYAGENITMSGIDWSLVRPGTFITIGEVELQVTAYAIPCFKNKAWFADGDFNAMSHERGWVSRVYALVHHTGSICAGDKVTLRY